MTEESTPEDEDMSPEQRMAWLRGRGIEIVTPEERKAGRATDDSAQHGQAIEYISIPADPSKPLEQQTFRPPSPMGAPTPGWSSCDPLADHLKTSFSGKSEKVDLSLLQQGGGASLLGSDGAPPALSEATLRDVASQGNVEVFSLVHATEANQYTGVNIYLDEAGMLKRLPLNKRATDFAARAGFNPPPQFFGDVFLGRVQKRPVVRNLPLTIGQDTSMDAEWLQHAATQNLQYQMEMNKLTGRSDTQPLAAGQDGKEKAEEGFSWTQTEEECEIVVPLPVEAGAKDIQVKFKSRTIQVDYQKSPRLILNLFEPIDVDSGTWTLDKTAAGTNRKLVLSVEKADAAVWPRIEN